MSPNTAETMEDARARDNDAAALPPLRNEGQRAMRLVPGSLSSIASAIGVDKGTVSRWRSGEKVPSAALRSRLHALYAIDPDAWDRRPHGSEPTPTPKTKSADADPSDRPRTELEITEARLTRLHQALESNPSFSDYIKIEAQIGDATKELRAIKREAEMLEARIVIDHPKFRAFTRGLVDVIRPFPAAAEAVAAYLGEIEANS